MKIKQLAASGLKKTRQFKHELAAMNLIVGPNFTGKTSIGVDAPLIAICGETRGAGSKSLKDLIEHTVLDVEALMDNGVKFNRRLTLKSNGSCSTSKQVPEDLTLHPLLLHPEAIADMSGATINDEIMALVKEDLRFDWPEFEKEKDKILLPAKHAAVLADLCEDLAASERAGRETAQPFLKWLSDEVDQMKMRAKQKEDTAKTFRASIAADESLNQGRSTADVEGLTKQLAEINAKIEAVQSRINSANTINDKRNAALSDRSKLASSEADLATHEQTFNALSAQLKSAEATRDGLLAEMNAAVGRAQQDFENAKASVSNLQRIVTASGDRIKALNDRTDKIGQMSFVCPCPKCGEQIDAEAIKSVLLADVKTQFKMECDFQFVKQSDLEAAVVHQTECLKAVKAAESAKVEKLKGPCADVSKIAQQIATLAEQRSRARANVELYKGRVIPEDQIPEAVSVEELTAEKNKLDAERKTIDDRRTIAIADSAAETKKEESRKQAEQFEAEADIRKQLAKILSTILTATINRTVGKVLDPINKFASPILGTDVVWDDGFTLAGRARSFKGMTEAEKIIICAAIAFALARESDIKLLIIDELGRMDEDVMLLLLENVHRLIADGQLDQFIGILARKETATPLALDPAWEIHVINTKKA